MEKSAIKDYDNPQVMSEALTELAEKVKEGKCVNSTLNYLKKLMPCIEREALRDKCQGTYNKYRNSCFEVRDRLCELLSTFGDEGVDLTIIDRPIMGLVGLCDARYEEVVFDEVRLDMGADNYPRVRLTDSNGDTLYLPDLVNENDVAAELLSAIYEVMDELAKEENAFNKYLNKKGE